MLTLFRRLSVRIFPAIAIFSLLTCIPIVSFAEVGDKVVVTARITSNVDYLDWFEVTSYTTSFTRPNGKKVFVEFYHCEQDDPEFEKNCADKIVNDFWGPWFGIWPTLDREYPHIGISGQVQTGGTYSIFGEVVYGNNEDTADLEQWTSYSLHVYGVCPENDQACLEAAGANDIDQGDDGGDDGGNNNNGDQCDGHDGTFPGRVGEDVSFDGTISGPITDLESFGAGSFPLTAMVGGSEMQISAVYFCTDGTSCAEQLGAPLRALNPCLELGSGPGVKFDQKELAAGLKVKGEGRFVYDSGSGAYEMFLHRLTKKKGDDNGGDGVPGSSCNEENAAMRQAKAQLTRADKRLSAAEKKLNSAVRKYSDDSGQNIKLQKATKRRDNQLAKVGSLAAKIDELQAKIDAGEIKKVKKANTRLRIMKRKKAIAERATARLEKQIDKMKAKGEGEIAKAQKRFDDALAEHEAASNTFASAENTYNQCMG